MKDRGVQSTDEPDTLVNMVKGKKSYGRGRGVMNSGNWRSKVCSYCGKIGHTINTYYRKHRFPSTFNSIFKFKGKNQANNTYVDGSEGDEKVDATPFTNEQYKSILAMIQQATQHTSTVANHVTSAAATRIPSTQDQISQEIIGLIKAKHGLYQLDTPYTKSLLNVQGGKHSLNSVYVIPKSALWHYRLGHLSFTRIQS